MSEAGVVSAVTERKPAMTSEQKVTALKGKYAYAIPMGLGDPKRFQLAAEVLFTTGIGYIAFIFALLAGVLVLDTMFAEKQGAGIEGAAISFDFSKLDYWKYTQFLLLGVLFSISAVAFNVNNLAKVLGK